MRLPIRFLSLVFAASLIGALSLPTTARAVFPPIDAPPAQPPSVPPAAAPTIPPEPATTPDPKAAPKPAPKGTSAQMHLELSLFGRLTLGADLADFAGATGHGQGNDASENIGLQLSVGVQYGSIEFGVDLARSVGGLDESQIDRRYFDSSDPAATAVTEDGGLRLWWVHSTSPSFQVMAGPHARWLIQTSESGVSQAQLNAFGVGAQLGFRWRTNRFSELVDGTLRVLGSAHGNFPTSLSVRRATGNLLFGSSKPQGSFFDVGLSVGYGVTFR